jgi:hemerythrin-like metal-binding protein
VQEAKKTIGEGVTTAQECAAVFGDIVKSSSEVSEMVSRIATANAEQAKGVEEISKAIHQLESATHSNSDASASCAESSTKLAVQVNDLRGTSSELGLLVEGKVRLPRFSWKASWTWGNALIDSQHKEWLELVNASLDACEKSGSKRASSQLAKLAGFTSVLFDKESEVFNQASNPGVDTLTERHQEILASLQRFSESGGHGLNPSSFSSFVEEHILAHLAESASAAAQNRNHPPLSQAA